MIASAIPLAPVSAIALWTAASTAKGDGGDGARPAEAVAGNRSKNGASHFFIAPDCSAHQPVRNGAFGSIDGHSPPYLPDSHKVQEIRSAGD